MRIRCFALFSLFIIFTNNRAAKVDSTTTGSPKNFTNSVVKQSPPNSPGNSTFELRRKLSDKINDTAGERKINVAVGNRTANKASPGKDESLGKAGKINGTISTNLRPLIGRRGKRENSTDLGKISGKNEANELTQTSTEPSGSAKYLVIPAKATETTTTKFTTVRPTDSPGNKKIEAVFRIMGDDNKIGNDKKIGKKEIDEGSEMKAIMKKLKSVSGARRATLIKKMERSVGIRYMDDYSDTSESASDYGDGYHYQKEQQHHERCCPCCCHGTSHHGRHGSKRKVRTGRTSAKEEPEKLKLTKSSRLTPAKNVRRTIPPNHELDSVYSKRRRIGKVDPATRVYLTTTKPTTTTRSMRATRPATTATTTTMRKNRVARKMGDLKKHPVVSEASTSARITKKCRRKKKNNIRTPVVDENRDAERPYNRANFEDVARETGTTTSTTSDDIFGGAVTERVPR